MNTIKAPFTNGSHAVETFPLWQYDYGQILQITGLDLPASYEVHFSNDPNGTATTALGDENGVAIPDIYLTKGDVYAWIYLHTGENDGETVYQIHIPVRARAAVSDQPPTPVQQSIIEQAISALNAGVTEVEGIAEGITQTIDTALAEAKASGEFDGEKGDPGDDGFSPTVAISEITKGHRVTVIDAEGDHAFDVLDGEDGSVTDVKVNGTTVVTDGVANIPAATNSSFGVTTTSTSNGLNIGTTGAMRTYPATDSDIKGGTQEYRPIVAKNQHQAAFYGLAKAAGDTSQSASSNEVGNYTADAIVKIQKMLGIYKSPWEQIRADIITNTTEDNIAITVDDNGQPFELTDIAISFVLSAESGETAKYGEYGRVRYYYDTNSYDDTLSNGINISVGGGKRGFYTFIEQNDNMLIKRTTSQIDSGSSGGLMMYVRDDRTSALYPIYILTEKRVYNKIEFRAVKGIANFVIYGRRKPN